jgi:hypothetical protein
MNRLVLAGVAGTVLALAAHAADIYRWTDENGKVFLSESVPPKYKDKATRIDSRQFELSPEQRRDAEARLARAKKELAASAPAPAGEPGAAAPLRPLPPASAPERTECEALQREYLDSLECFAPFVNANGSLKPNAFAACKAVVDPSPKCGPLKSY